LSVPAYSRLPPALKSLFPPASACFLPVSACFPPVSAGACFAYFLFPPHSEHLKFAFTPAAARPWHISGRSTAALAP